MVRAVIISAAAEEDVRNIAHYIARDNPQAAGLFEIEFAEAIERLREFPQMGHTTKEFHEPVLLARISERFRRYLICYRIVNDSRIRIVRVLHGARDIAAVFGEA